MDYVLTVMLTVNAWSDGYQIWMATPTAGPNVVSEVFPGLESCERRMVSTVFEAAMPQQPWLAACKPVKVMWKFERPHR